MAHTRVCVVGKHLQCRILRISADFRGQDLCSAAGVVPRISADKPKFSNRCPQMFIYPPNILHGPCDILKEQYHYENLLHTDCMAHLLALPGKELFERNVPPRMTEVMPFGQARFQQCFARFATFFMVPKESTTEPVEKRTKTKEKAEAEATHGRPDAEKRSTTSGFHP